MVDITFKFSRKEFIKGYTSHAGQRQRVLLYVILGGIILFVLLAVFFFNGFEDSTVFDYILLFTGLFLLFSENTLKFKHGKFYDSTPSLQNEIHYTFSDKSFKSSGENYTGEVNWSVVYQVLQNKDYFYIYINREIMYIIPKRAFTADKLHDFKEILKSQRELKKEFIS